MNKYSKRSDVYYDLDISHHKLEVNYSEIHSLTFVFSSKLYKNIFKRKLEENRKKITESLTKRWGFPVKNDVLADIKLYSKTEKRGFLIKGKEDYKCLSTIELDGNHLMNKN